MNQEKINRINELYKSRRQGQLRRRKKTSSPFFVQSILLQFAIICEIH